MPGRQQSKRRQKPLRQRQDQKTEQSQNTHEVSVRRCGSVQEEKRQRGKQTQNDATKAEFDQKAHHHSFPL